MNYLKRIVKFVLPIFSDISRTKGLTPLLYQYQYHYKEKVFLYSNSFTNLGGAPRKSPDCPVCNTSFSTSMKLVQTNSLLRIQIQILIHNCISLYLTLLKMHPFTSPVHFVRNFRVNRWNFYRITRGVSRGRRYLLRVLK